MAKQAVTKDAVAKAVPWTLLQEAMFDDFFGKKLSYEGFTIEKVVGGYQATSGSTALPLVAETITVQKAQTLLR